jgi:molybdopterin converting factor small subunit
MKIFLFAQARSLAGRPVIDLPLHTTLSQPDFWTRLLLAHPTLAPLQKTSRLARDEAYLTPEETLHPHDEIALIPPVSGG